MNRSAVVTFVVGFAGAGSAFAQDAMPSPQTAAEEHGEELASADDASSFPAHSWEMPAIEVEGERASPYREEDRIGSYGQPRWSANRRFPTTRVYVVPAGKMEIEWWNRWQAPLAHLVGSCREEDTDGDPATAPETVCVGRKLKSQYELEMGLGHRLQLDLYLQFVQEGPAQPIVLDEEKVELRYALADWGVLPGNPTLYLEWARHSGDVDFLEGKVLFGGEAAPGWHWGANLVVEHSLGGPNEAHYAASLGLGRTIVDEELSLGLEAKTELSSEGDQDLATGKEFFGGPSLAWHPVPPMHVLFTPLLGVEIAEETEGRFEGWLITGWTL